MFRILPLPLSVPKEKSKSKRKFRGFRAPNFTSVPDDLFDELLPDLTGAELKVLLYIIRRTYGFKKESDPISLSQMLNGITTRDDKVLDRGVGVTKPSLLKALRSLQDQNIIRAIRQRNENRGDQPTIYSLVMDNEQGGKKDLPPVVKKVNHPLVKNLDQAPGQQTEPGPRSTNLTTQDTEAQNTEKQDTEGQYTVQQQDDVVAALTEFGLDQSSITGIIKARPDDYILEKIRQVRWLINSDPDSVKNPPGFLRTAIEGDWPPPHGYTQAKVEETPDCDICNGSNWIPVGDIQVHCDHQGTGSPLAYLPPESG
jgi:hypothetical protein